MGYESQVPHSEKEGNRYLATAIEETDAYQYTFNPALTENEARRIGISEIFTKTLGPATLQDGLNLAKVADSSENVLNIRLSKSRDKKDVTKFFEALNKTGLVSISFSNETYTEEVKKPTIKVKPNQTVVARIEMNKDGKTNFSGFAVIDKTTKQTAEKIPVDLGFEVNSENFASSLSSLTGRLDKYDIIEE